MAAPAEPPPDVGIDALLDSSPEPEIHESGAAELGLVLGILALAGSLFALTAGAALVCGGLAVVLGIVAMARTSKPNVAGRSMVPAELALGFLALAFVGLQYLGLDPAPGDAASGSLATWLEGLNSVLGL